jgi:hypothetical protein
VVIDELESIEVKTSSSGKRKAADTAQKLD